MSTVANSTIAAIATGPAPGGIGILRMSGPQALVAARSVAPLLPAILQPRRAYFVSLRDELQRPLDEAIVLYFQNPHSFTGEEVVELQTHGSPKLLRMILERLIQVEGVRHADAGEFTQRAFLNGRIDLARAEAVASLIAANSEAAVRAAALQLSGQFSDRIQAIRRPLVELAADVEASLDFPDESQSEVPDDFGARLKASHFLVHNLLQDSRHGTLLKRAPRVVLYGAVNAGKSTLFNRLSGEQRALVDAEPGTTRDLLSAEIEIEGVKVTLVDSAGLRENPGRIEALGIARATEALLGADLAVLVVAPEATLGEVQAWQSLVPAERRVEIRGKSDLPAKSLWNSLLGVSGTTGEGISELKAQMLSRLGLGSIAEVSSLSERHVDALARALQALERGMAAVEHGMLELVAGEINLCLGALSEVTGEEVTADVIDAIFRRFCIGK